MDVEVAYLTVEMLQEIDTLLKDYLYEQELIYFKDKLFINTITIYSVRKYAKIFKPRKFTCQEWIYKQGDPSKYIYFVKSGQVELSYKIPGVQIREEIEEEFRQSLQFFSSELASRNLMYGQANVFVSPSLIY